MIAHLTMEQRQLARRLHAKGPSLREIGRQVGCSHEVVGPSSGGSPSDLCDRSRGSPGPGD
jgi:Helix-turn-helix domain